MPGVDWNVCVCSALFCSALCLLPSCRLRLAGQELWAQKDLKCAGHQHLSICLVFSWKIQKTFLPFIMIPNVWRKQFINTKGCIEKETRKLGSQRGNYREECSSPVSRSSGLKGLVAFGLSELMVSWVYFGPVSDLKYSILSFSLSQTIKSLAFWRGIWERHCYPMVLSLVDP